MYRRFYNLTRNPFEITPDPFFFYPTARHNEALANLAYGVQRRKGFVVVTGEVGTGKTLLIRCLLDSLTRNKTTFAFVYNPRLSVADFLGHVLSDLRISSTGRSKTETLNQLNGYLISRAQAGQTTALIVDEAHLLTWELLEEIRLLTNLETSQHKLLQIVLAGQPELDRKLDSPELRQLKQRIGLRCNLEPLGLDELSGYVHRRLQLAGAESELSLFPDESVRAIHKFSNGIPRVVNTLGENALIEGYSRQAKQITPDIIEQVAGDLRLLAAAPPTIPSTEVGEKLLKVISQMIEQLNSELNGSHAAGNVKHRLDAE